ncbi:MAG: response regulator transcription factor [Turicibacter sp.]|nr:response regulator transcription factor [Turicibacter sp.]
MGYTLLVVDHDAIIREQVAGHLRSKYTVLEGDSAEKALAIFQSQRIDLVVADLVLPAKSGLELVREIRSQGQTPIAALTIRDGAEDQIQAYEAGVDDFIAKPCDLRLLSLKIGRLLDRCYPNGIEERHLLIYDTLEVNKLSRIVRLGGEEVPFRPKEFDLLVLLMENAGTVMDRDRILDAIWSVDYFGDSRVVDTHVKKIRKKIGPYARQVATVFGVGYKFEK